jgi:hypothetical protein
MSSTFTAVIVRDDMSEEIPNNPLGARCRNVLRVWRWDGGAARLGFAA